MVRQDKKRTREIVGVKIKYWRHRKVGQEADPGDSRGENKLREDKDD